MTVYVCLVVILRVVLGITFGVEVAAVCFIVLKFYGGHAVSMARVMVVMVGLASLL
jgi:hypothetical protein